jgi:hypothetical protein
MLAFSANAATVKLGGDGGELNFNPSSVTIAKGESVTWCARRRGGPGRAPPPIGAAAARAPAANCPRVIVAHAKPPT